MPLVPVTFMTKVPVGVELVVAILSVEVNGGFWVWGLNVGVAPKGTFVNVRATGMGKPPSSATLMA